MILREAFDYVFSTLDPHADHIDPPSVAVYETVIVKGPDWQGHPVLAEGWTVSGDGLEWRVRLQPGLRFHSGAACDAAAIKAALDGLRFEAQADRELWYWDPVESLTLDGETLVFRLHYPYARLPSLLWGTHTAVYNDALRRTAKDEFGRTVADGTGPFKMVSWSPERIVAERFDGYRSPAAPFLAPGRIPLERIEWISIPDEDERLAALERGEVDCLHAPPLAELPRLRQDPRFVVTEHPQPANMYLALDWRRTELGFDDLRVRQAVSLALDRDALVAGAYAGCGFPSYGPVPPGDELYTPEVDSAGVHDPAGAARLLDRAGFVRGEDGVRTRAGHRLTFECVLQDDQLFRRVGELLQRQLRAVGVEVELRPVVPFGPFYRAVAAGPAASISKWLWQDPVDAAIGFSASYNRPFPNWQQASVPELDEAYGTWLRAGAGDELRRAAGEVNRVFARTLPYVPLLTPSDVWVHGTHVHGYRPFAANLYPFYQGVWIER